MHRNRTKLKKRRWKRRKPRRMPSKPAARKPKEAKSADGVARAVVAADGLRNPRSNGARHAVQPAMQRRRNRSMGNQLKRLRPRRAAKLPTAATNAFANVRHGG